MSAPYAGVVIEAGATAAEFSPNALPPTTRREAGTLVIGCRAMAKVIRTRGPVAGPLIDDRDHDPYFVAGRRVAARSPIFRP